MTRRSTSGSRGTLYLVAVLIVLALAWFGLRSLSGGSAGETAAGPGPGATTSVTAPDRSTPKPGQSRDESRTRASTTSPDRASAETRRRSSQRSSLSTCDLATLPPEADDTVALIEAGGPFPHPRNDGVTFGNREGLLPQERRGYYREYTVDTPRASTRGARRIVTGGNPATDPPHWYYTADHYDSFCVLTGR